MAVSKKKKKKYLGLGILVVACIALFAGYGILSKQNAAEEEEETTAAPTENLFDCVNTDILEVSYRVGEDSLTFARSSSDNDWCDVEDEDLPIDQTAVGAVVTTACAITVNQEITTSLDDAASFGLDDPEYEVTMTDDEGNTYTLYIGNTTGSSDQKRYAYVEGQTRIVSIANTIVTKLNVDLQSLLVVEEYPSFDTDDMTRIYYEDDTQTLELFNNPEDLTEAEAIGTTTWYYKDADGIYMPLHQGHSTIMLDDIAGITFDACENYSATDEEMETYGLLEPAAKLTIDYTETESGLVETETTNDSGSSYVNETTTSNYSFTLNIGNKCEDEDAYYVSLNDGRVVYRTGAETIELFTQNNLEDYCMALYPALCNFNGIEKIDVTLQDQSLELTVKQSTTTDEDGEEETVYDCSLNGKTCEESDARTLFGYLIKVTADHILSDDEVKEDSKVLYSCTYYTSYEKKPEINIEISELNSTYYQMSLNGRIKYAVTKQEFNTLVSNLEEYLQ